MRKRSSVRLRHLIVTCLGLVCALGAQAAGKPRVLTSFLPLTAHTMAIAGDDAVVEQLLSHSVGAHDYQLRPSDARKVASADLIIINGLGLEDWLQPMLDSVGKQAAAVVVTSQDMPALTCKERLTWGHTAGQAPEKLPDDCDACANERAAGQNPHVWLDPLLAKFQARRIAEALCRINPEAASRYNERLHAYEHRLEALNDRIATTLLPIQGSRLITFHNAFPYLAARYNLHLAGVVESFPGREPSPRELAELMGKIERLNINVIFAEKGYETRLLETIARQTGARVAELDTLEVGPPSPTAYLDRMEGNFEVLAKSFELPLVAAQDAQ